MCNGIDFCVKKASLDSNLKIEKQKKMETASSSVNKIGGMTLFVNTL